MRRPWAQNVGGFYAQDQWRVTPQLTLNYGLRWEFTGAATNANFEALLINALNHRNPIVGSTGGATQSIDSTTFGQTTTNAIGARQVQFRLGLNF